MKKHLVILAIGIIAAVMPGCRKSESSKVAESDSLEWNISVCEVIPVDGLLTDGNGYKYAVSDTAAVNQELAGLSISDYAWTLPDNDTVFLAVYNPVPLIAETVTAGEPEIISEYGIVQVPFKFSDKEKWGDITESNIEKRLAVFVDGKLINAPKVNCRISSGNCSVTIPLSVSAEFLPDIE